jgi:hypothetical protein
LKESNRKRNSRVSASEADKNGTSVLSCSVLDKPPPEIESGGPGGAPGDETVVDARPPPALPNQTDAFAAFFAAWPEGHRTDRHPAEREWRAINPSRELAAVIVGAVERWKKSERWLSGIVMSPAKWLHDRQWESDPPPEPRKETRDGSSRRSGNAQANARANGRKYRYDESAHPDGDGRS